ncbi:MAG: anhydro-N-acetylmuramic acid kinase [Nitrospirae bacterium]|nr:anhydro-N-acetylmuramic acid kinase [Nitrospirota bacterium]
MSDTLTAIGLMSGTSADGIDAALVTVERKPRRVTLRHYCEVPHPPARRERILAAARGQLNTEGICRLHAELGEAFAQAALALCAAADHAPARVAVVGSHGQTVWHAPDAHPPGTLQLGDASRIAAALGTPVVADFRSADLALGGQGAPLAPLLHHVLFGHPFKSRAVVNIGGIANVTWLKAGTGLEDVGALDSGPGNMVLDALAHRFSGGRQAMDQNGEWAARGRVDRPFLDELLANPYFSRPAPKSTGREVFGAPYAERLAADASARGLEHADALATATALTAHTIAREVMRMGRADEVLLCGGGAGNGTLLAMIADCLPGVPVRTTDDAGVPGTALEAMAFAELACRHLWGEPGNLPRVTGARGAAVLGALTPAPMV